MEKIFVAAKTDRVDVVAAIRERCGTPLRALREALLAGKPFVEIDFPLSDDGGSWLLELIHKLEAMGVVPLVYEWSARDELPGKLMSMKLVRNLGRPVRQEHD